MKNLCGECEMDCKIEYCCPSNPETGESASLILEEGRKIFVCLNLDSEGYCSVYGTSLMPDACREFYCHKFSESSLTELIS